jgi:Tfp pilus assembly major pilin PilA
MNNNIKQQSGSFFAELGAVIASISILTLVGTSYMESMAGRAQVTEAYIKMQPIINSVNSFYSQHGIIGGPTANYLAIDVYNNSDGTDDDPNQTTTNTPQPYAGRFVQDVQSLTNGVVFAQMNIQHTDSVNTEQTVGKVSNVQSAIQGEYIIMVPFLIGDPTDDDGNIIDNPSEHTSLRWACVTTINSNPPTGTIIPAITATTMNEQYFYAPGCVVITKDQAACLDPTGDADTFDSATACAGTPYTTPRNYNTSLFTILSGT